MVFREMDFPALLPTITFITDFDNPFVDEHALSNCYQNPLLLGADEGQRKKYFRFGLPTFTNRLDEVLGLTERGALLDAGIGDEWPILKALRDRGVKVYGLELRDWPNAYAPKKPRDPTSVRYDGDIALVNDPGSALFSFRFGTILFWGSWDTAGSGDMNQMIGNTVYARAKRKDISYPLYRIRDEVSTERDAIVRACKAVLAPKGLIGMVSARYSFFGGGFGYTHFDHEMVSFLDALRRGFDHGALQATMLGQTRTAVREMLLAETQQMEKHKLYSRSDIDRPRILAQRMEQQLTFPNTIPDSFLPSQDVHRANELWTNIPQHTDIGHIDAVFMEF